MLKSFYPKECADSSYVIDYKGLYKKGYRGLIFDIDNTLVEHDAPANDKAIQLISKLKEIGFQVCLLSNNDEERVLLFNKDVNVHYIYNAHKPNAKNYNEAMKLMGTNKSNTVFIGDQLFTDVFGANRAGLMNFFVKPLGPEIEIQIVLKRHLERIVLYYYRKHKAKTKGKR